MPLSPSETVDLKTGTLAFGAEDTSEAVVATRTVSGNYTATTLIKSANAGNDEIVGLAGYSWRGNAVGIGFGQGKVSVFRRENGKQEIAASADDAPETQNIYLRMTATAANLINSLTVWTETLGRIWENRLPAAMSKARESL